MLGEIPFVVPGLYKAALASGELVRFGALLKDSGTGQIVAHLQESGLASTILGGIGGGPLGFGMNVLNMASSGYSNVQLAQLKTMVEGLQVLQYATIGATIVGIGVSAIGFAMMNKKLHSIQSQITDLSKRMDQRFRELHERELRGHLSRIQGLFERADQAHYLKTPEQEWQHVAGVLADESAFFRGEISFHLGQPTFDADLFSVLFRSLAISSAGRIESLMLANEMDAAHKFSLDMGRHYRTLFDDLSPTTLASKVADKDVQWNHKSFHKLKNVQVEMKQVVQGLREATDSMLTRPHLLETLMNKGIDGRQYMAALREEKERPLLLLEAV